MSSQCDRRRGSAIRFWSLKCPQWAARKWNAFGRSCIQNFSKPGVQSLTPAWPKSLVNPQLPKASPEQLSSPLTARPILKTASTQALSSPRRLRRLECLPLIFDGGRYEKLGASADQYTKATRSRTPSSTTSCPRDLHGLIADFLARPDRLDPLKHHSRSSPPGWRPVRPFTPCARPVQ